MKIIGPRKCRPRIHVIADLAVHFVEGPILEEGHTAERFQFDYGYDRLMVTYDEFGYIEPGAIRMQVKATETLDGAGDGFRFDVDTRDVNLWLMERSLVVLVLYDASRKRAFWLNIQRYFREDFSSRPKKGSKTVRVQIPASQRWNRRAVRSLRQAKLELFHDLKETL